MSPRRPLFPDLPRPILFAHRGVSARAPENTRAAFELARLEGVPAVELDIHLCASGELVVTHDRSTKRVSGADHDIQTTPWDILRELDVGSWKGDAFRGERIPLLGDLFEEYRDALRFDIEIKSDSVTDAGLERALADLVASMGMTDRVAVSSFNPFALRRFKALAPAIPTALIYCDHDEQVPWFLRRGQGRLVAACDYMKPSKLLTGRATALARALGGRPFVPWVVDDRQEALRLIALGCDGLVSNDPAALGKF